MSFSVRWRDSLLDVVVDRTDATYRLRDAGQEVVVVRHAGTEVEISGGRAVVLPLRARVARPTPSQPAGREPVQRTALAAELRPAA